MLRATSRSQGTQQPWQVTRRTALPSSKAELTRSGSTIPNRKTSMGECEPLGGAWAAIPYPLERGVGVGKDGE
jgi:hypothetical protein